MANKSAEKLYNALKSQGKYTKSFAEFQGLLSDKQRSQKLYTALSNDGLYTKSFSDFSKQFSSGETAPTHPQTTTPKKRDVVADTINMLRTPSSQYTRPQPSKAAGTFEMPSKYDIYHNMPDAVKRHQTPTPLKPEAVMPSVPSNAAESVWAAADKAESADVREKVDEGWSWRKIMQALSSGASVTGGLGDDNAQALETTSVAHLKTHDLQKLSDQAWAALGSKQQQSIINDTYSYLKEQYPDADDKALVDAARKMARAKSDEQMYNLAVEKNMPKSVGEFFLRKAAAASSFGSLSKGYASMMAGTRGDMEAEDTALQKYGAKHKVADIAGSVAGFAVDPLTYASGAVGGAATKVALWTGGKVLSEAAIRKMSQTLGGKLLLGAVGGAANFGTFEAGGEALNQYKWGGTLDVDPETGRYVVGDFSVGKIASQMRHGLTMGGLTGAFGTWLGNVSTKAAQATSSTLGKLGVRTGELGVGLVGEGTIFATPEFISTYGEYNDVIKSVSDKNSPNYIADDKERSKYIAEIKAQRGERMMDIWQDNLAMIAGFKAQHALKSAGRTISELAASRRGKVGFVERMGRMLDGHPSLALSKEEQTELDKHGYGDLTQMVKEYKAYAQKDGDLPYSKITQLLNDKNVSEAARAKMYYYVTGHSLPMSAVIASNVIDNGDKTYTVQSLGDNGVITSRTYGSRKRADYEKARIDRQAELNGVAMAEQMFDNIDKAERLKAVCTRLAQDKGVSPETLLWLTRKDPKQMTAAEKRWIKEIEDAANEDAPQGENATVRHIKGVILDEYGVDVDKALRKAADSRTDAEKTAISAYNDELAQAVAERKNAIRQDETTDAYRRGYEADTQGMRDAYVAQMYEPSEDNAETLRGVESQITESAKYQAALERDELTQMTHKDGSIHLATLKDKDKDGNGKQVYIVDGDIVMKEDGSGIDADASSKSVIIYDPATGEKKMVSPTAVDGIESLGEVKTAEQREAEINARMQDTIQSGKDWLEGNVANPVGMQIQLGDGRIATIEAMHEDGKSAIATLPDGTQFLVPNDVLQRIVNNGQYADYKARRDAEASKREAEQDTESAPETATEGGQPLPEEASPKEEERREYAQGDVFDVVVDGQKMHAEIVSPKDADGRFVVNVDDGESMRTLYVTPEELAAMEYREEPSPKAEETGLATEGSSEKALERDAVAKMVEYFKNRGDKEGVRRMKAADKLLAEFESALKEGVAPEQVKPEDVERSVRESRSEKTELTAEERELRDNLVERMRKGGLDVVTDSEEMQRVIDTENERTRNMFVGEKGATEADKAEEVSTRLDNLSVARRMEEAGKDAKTIKMATGWERGSDGKWRYETSDIKPKPFEEWMNKKNLKLGDIIDSDSGLFEMYPELKDFKVTRGKGKSTNAAIYTGLGKIEINFSKFKPYMSIPSNREKINGILHRVINHEIQHAIQDSEGFAQGVSPNAFRPDAPIGKLREMEEADGRMVERYNAMSYTEKALGEGVRLKERILENRKEYNALASKYRFGMDGYTMAAGEVEARNTEKRIGMTEEERKASLASETEDVAREDQILLGVDNADEEVNTGSVREHRVYHGSGADFDAFDHSHMGEGEGAQAYGWGTYVTEVEGIGRTYAIQNTTKHNDALRALQHDVDAISDQLDRHRDDLKYVEEQLKRANEWRAEAELDYELFKDEAEELKEKYGESSPKYRNHLFNDIYTDEMKRAQSSVKSTEESIQYRKEKIAELEKALKDKQAEIDELPKEFPRHLYTVEIPDDNGSNYLDWNGHPAESLLKGVGSFLESEGFERVQDSPVRYEKGESTVVLNPNATGADLYAELREALGSDKKASQALAELGCIGIKYPADNMRGGREDGAKNYVIFNENDAKITDHTRFLRTAGGEVYGLVKDGRIYLDPKVATSETAVHEYTHLWGDMLRRKDSEQWSHTVKELKNSVLWEEVKELYPELKTDDEIADEVLSTFSGRRGAERLREEARRVAEGEGGVFTKAKAIETLERVKEAIARFWEGVARMFGINRYRSAEELADMAMRDLLDSKNPMKDESGMRKRGEVGETLATSGTYFSGGGLLEAGLKGVIDPKVAVEFSEKIAGVYADNHGNHIVVADVRDVDPKKLVGAVDGGEVQYFHASPVCKNFSKAKREGGEVELDKETALSTAEFIAKTRPKVVTIENVKGYRNSEALKIITDELTRQGYDWDADVYNAADYGGYTKRERLIVRAKRDGKLPPKPEKLPEELRKKGWYSAVEDLIPHLEEKKTGVPQGTDERLKNSGIDYRTIDKPLYVFGRGYANKTVGHAFADELLPTLTTGGGDIIIMPDGRVLKASPRVLARVTGLPDTYKMPETDQLSHTIVGNGIPTQLTEGVIAPLLDNAIPSAERATKRESVFDVADRVSQNLEERTRAMAVKKANDRFNEELELQVKGELEEGHVYKLGMPSEILLSTGVPNLPIELSAKQLSKKAADRGHRFDVKDIANLPQAIQAPIAVFEYGNKDKSQNLIVEIERDGKKFVVGIHFNQNRRGIVVNDIRGLFNKDSHEWLNWISQGKLLYADKEKIQALMDKQRTNLAEVNYLNLDDVAKKVKDFENPKLFDGKISEVDKKGSDSIDRSVRENPKNEDKPRYSRKPGESIFDYASRVSEDVDRSVRERVSARDEYEKKVKSKGFQTKEALQNSMLGLQEFMSAIDHASGDKRYIEDIPDFENPILGENRLSSVNKEEMHQVAKTQFKPLMSAVAKLSGNGKESGELYDYMFAKHGLERDAVMRQREAQKEFDKYQKANPKGTKTIGDFVASLEGKDYAGLTALTAEDGRVKSIQSQIDAIDEQMKATDDQLLLRNLGGQKKRLKVDLLNAARDAADDIRKAFESNPSHDRSDINELWSRVNEVNGNTLRKLYESGLLTKEAYNDISSMYTNYIPMRGFDQTTSADAYAYLTHGDSAFNAPIKTAKGRSSKADNPIAYMQAMAESAIMQGNRNVLVKQKMLNFVRNHPSDLASVSDVWLQYDSVADEWKPVFPDNIGANDSASVVAKKMEAFEDKMKQMAEKHPDLVQRSNEAPDIPYKVVEKGQLNEHQVLVKQNGKSYIITVNGSPRAAQAANGLTNPDTDLTGAVGKVFEGAEALNRQLSSLYTTLNPDFIGSNYVRDALYSNTMVYVKEGAKYGGSFNLNFAKYNPAEMANLYARYNKGSLDTSNETHRLFLEFMQNGGETGFVNLKQIEKRKSEIAKAIKRDGRISAAQIWGGLNDAVDFANRAVENSARFAAYVTSRKSGRSVGRSVYDAKEISVNFNRKGSGSKFMGAEGQTKAGNAAAFVSGAGRGLYIFWNAGIQGLANFSRQIGRHPGRALTLASLLFGFGALMSYLGNRDDDDENNYFNLPKYIRRSNVCYKIGDLFVTIPLPVEYRSFYGLGELASSTLAGKEDGTTKDIAKEAVSQVSQLFPIDFAEGGGGLHALIPSAVKPIVEAETNTAWTGLPIYKDNDFNKNMPEYTKVYKTANGHLVEIARALNDATGGNKYKKGFIDINPAKMEYVLKGMLGGAFSFPDKLVKTTETIMGDREFDWRNTPFANRFVKNADERTEYKSLNEQYFKLKDEMDVVKQQLKGFEKEADAGNEKYEKALLQLEDSKDYERLELFKDYEKELKGLNDELKELRMSPDYDKAEEKELQKEIAELQRQLIDEMREIKK